MCVWWSVVVCVRSVYVCGGVCGCVVADVYRWYGFVCVCGGVCVVYVCGGGVCVCGDGYV